MIEEFDVNNKPSGIQEFPIEEFPVEAKKSLLEVASIPGKKIEEFAVRAGEMIDESPLLSGIKKTFDSPLNVASVPIKAAGFVTELLGVAGEHTATWLAESGWTPYGKGWNPYAAAGVGFAVQNADQLLMMGAEAGRVGKVGSAPRSTKDIIPTLKVSGISKAEDVLVHKVVTDIQPHIPEIVTELPAHLRTPVVETKIGKSQLLGQAPVTEGPAGPAEMTGRGPTSIALFKQATGNPKAAEKFVSKMKGDTPHQYTVTVPEKGEFGDIYTAKAGQTPDVVTKKTKVTFENPVVIPAMTQEHVARFFGLDPDEMNFKTSGDMINNVMDTAGRQGYDAIVIGSLEKPVQILKPNLVVPRQKSYETVRAQREDVGYPYSENTILRGGIFTADTSKEYLVNENYHVKTSGDKILYSMMNEGGEVKVTDKPKFKKPFVVNSTSENVEVSGTALRQILPDVYDKLKTTTQTKANGPRMLAEAGVPLDHIDKIMDSPGAFYMVRDRIVAETLKKQGYDAAVLNNTYSGNAEIFYLPDFKDFKIGEPGKPTFTMRDNPDLTKLPQADPNAIMKAERPTDMRQGESLADYTRRKQLSGNVPDFREVIMKVDDAARVNPTVSDIIDESRAQFSGEKPDLNVKQTTTETVIEPKSIPQDEPHLATTNETSINNTSKISPAARTIGIPPGLVDSSPLLMGTEKVPALKPEAMSGSVAGFRSFWNKLAHSTEDVIGKMGQYGQELAGAIRTVRDVPDVRYGAFTAEFDRFFLGMNKQQANKVAEALANHLEGKPTKVPLPDGLLEFVRTEFGKIAEEASALQMTIRNSEGAEIPFTPREGFFPKMLRRDILNDIISFKKNVVDKIADHFVSSGQAADRNMAFERARAWRSKLFARRYGHLERAREVDLPGDFYDRNALRVIPQYMRDALTRLEEVRRFGLHDVKALEMLDGIKAEGHDFELASRAYRRLMGVEPVDASIKNGVQFAKNWTTGFMIQFQSTITQLAQIASPAIHGSIKDAGWNFFRTFTRLGQEDAARAGQVFRDSMTDYLKEGYGGAGYGSGSQFANGALRLTGFVQLDQFLRKYAANTGRDYIEKTLVPGFLKGSSRAKFFELELKNLGVDPVKLQKAGKLSSLELNTASKRFADTTQGNPDVTTLPLFWTDPIGRLFAQFKSFSFVVGKSNINLVKRAIESGDAATLIKVPAGMLTTGYAISEIKQAMGIQNDEEITGHPEADKAIHILQNASAFGPTVDLFLSSMKGSDAVTNVLGPPSLKFASSIIGAVGQAIKGKPGQLERLIVKRTPVIGRFLYNRTYGKGKLRGKSQG